MLNKKIQNRLFNWKFNSALYYVDDNVTREELQVIDALAAEFGNCGWGQNGEAGRRIESILLPLIGPNEDMIFLLSRDP